MKKHARKQAQVLEREREDLKEGPFKRGLGEVRENSVENLLLVMLSHLQDTLQL